MGLEVCGLLISFLLYLLDQGTDALTALLFIREGYYLIGSVTILLMLSPGLCSFLLELQSMWRGRGNLPTALGYLLFCPLWAALLHLYSIYNGEYRAKAVFFKTMEGFMCAGPQLAFQLSVLMKGTLTSSTGAVLAPYLNLTMDPNVETMELLGREYDEESRYWFGVSHIVSIGLSFVSLFTSVLYFNELEDKKPVSCAKFCFGIPFFFLTIVFRTTTIALLICFLQWWSAPLLFVLFFSTVITALCIGDRFGRACIYGVWSLLVPVGYARDPVAPMGYKEVPNVAELDPAIEKEMKQWSARARWFLSSHILTSLFILFPALIILTALVHRAQVLELLIDTRSAFPVWMLSMVFLPCLGLVLAVSVLLVRPYHRCQCTMPEKKKGNYSFNTDV